MQSNAIFHFYCSLYLLISGVLIVSSVWSIALFCCHIYRLHSNLGSTGALRNSSIWNNELSKIMISFSCLKYSIPVFFQYWKIFPDTSHPYFTVNSYGFLARGKARKSTLSDKQADIMHGTCGGGKTKFRISCNKDLNPKEKTEFVCFSFLSCNLYLLTRKAGFRLCSNDLPLAWAIYKSTYSWNALNNILFIFTAFKHE